jgi:ribonucleotide reductase beta subunit family protein with ferritin-like domain
MINAIQKETSNLIPQDLFINIMNTAVEHENKFSMATLGNCVGFSEQIIKGYTGYRANILLKRVGIADNPYKSFIKNPFAHYDAVAEGTDGITRESNVFTNQVVDYQFKDAEGGWNEQDIFG